MHNRTVRNLTILAIVILCVVSARPPLTNAVFALVVGVRVMAKLFKHLFGPQQGFENLSWGKFILRFPLINNLPMLATKQGILTLIWWSLGIFATYRTYELLNLLLV